MYPILWNCSPSLFFSSGDTSGLIFQWSYDIVSLSSEIMYLLSSKGLNTSFSTRMVWSGLLKLLMEKKETTLWYYLRKLYIFKTVRFEFVCAQTIFFIPITTLLVRLFESKTRYIFDLKRTNSSSGFPAHLSINFPKTFAFIGIVQKVSGWLVGGIVQDQVFTHIFVNIFSL